MIENKPQGTYVNPLLLQNKPQELNESQNTYVNPLLFQNKSSIKKLLTFNKQELIF